MAIDVAAPRAGSPGAAAPALALLANAFVWGVSWWPLRELQALGLHPLWATVFVYGSVVLAISAWRPSAWPELLRTPVLWVLVAAAGTTNATFNWGVTVGDVVRVVLLFYLMPLWTVLLARLLLGERMTRAAAFRVAMALVGAAVVLWPEGGGLPLPRTLPEWLGIAGGFSFALNNVMLRREAHRPQSARALAMFLGGVVVAGPLAAMLALNGVVPPPPAPAPGWIAGALLLAVCFLGGNLALQYGAARLPANATAVVMITEVLFASASAVLLGAAAITLPLVIGGTLIVGAALLAAR
ncbi:DMT family transporter [Rubrivivax benzoatilyticus]|uniref:DMT family transporter n=1 Tax=Rubrivivax benzoatilyticus TaxID=316997 RepID=A0ABX0HUZ5_9BURK|nr:DMT family transporter [Rubrivivax benzoatilyticus]EGJ12417.1 putative transmembrane protein [Rubrivivax benzoatilyticus JA2 = ATCC BAA-35]NHK98852.1 DMT family transporter [Rubrivivax benzoatilyticus]NHL24354.1 DMT family transporter [Rubrivivax benzoatilyticus]